MGKSDDPAGMPPKVRRNDEGRGVPLRQVRSNSWHAREKVSGPDNAADGRFSAAYGIGKYLVNRLNIKGMERMEKAKLARMN